MSDAVGNSGAGRSRWLPPFATIAAGALIYLLAYDAPMLRALEGRTIDWRFQARGAATAGPEVLLVLIDDSSIASAGGWPLPRRVLADAVTALRDAGARVIALDLLLADPLGEGDMELVRRVGADDDVVVPFAFVFDDGGERAPPAVREAAVDIRQGIGAGGGRGGVVPPFPALARAAEMGHAEVIVDADNRLRFLHAAIPHQGQLYPALPVVVAQRHRTPGSGIAVSARDGLSLGDVSFSLDGALRLPIDFPGPAGSLPSWSLDDLLAGRVPGGAVEGRAAFVGVVATGLGDRFATPYGPGVPGVEVLASAADNLISGRTLRHDALTRMVSFAALLTGSVAFALFAGRARPGMAAAGCGALLVMWLAGLQLAFVRGGWWIDAALPTATMLAAAAAAALPRIISTDHARRRLSRYVPTGFAEALGRDEPGFGRGRRPATILFVDIRGFTTLSEALGPERSAALLEGFYAAVEASVEAHAGAIDSYLGDGAMAVFGMAASAPDDPVRALACARQMAGRLEAWSGGTDTPADWRWGFGIGVHHGPVVVGPIGGQRRFELTATGDTVNVASRLQALGADLAATVVISETVAAAARAAGRTDLLDGFEALPEQTVRGRREPLDLHVLPRTAS